MKKQLLILIFLLPFLSQAKDIFFNRLEKLHAKDQKKCLEVSKRYMNWFPDKAAPNYFASIIYQERSTKSRTLQGRYRNVKKAIGYAMKFEEMDDGTLRTEVDWDTYRTDLTRQAFDVVGRLQDAGEERYGTLLMASLEKFDDNMEIVVVEDDQEVQDEMRTAHFTVLPTTPNNTETNERLIVDANSTIEFFGLPHGNEFIMSSNPNGEQQLLVLINEERERQGMHPLEWDDQLAQACRYHSYDLATQNYFNHDSHDRKNGKLEKVGGTFDRIRRFYSKSFVNSENIAAGNESPEATYEQWFNSPGHYENMFNPTSTKVGLGVFYDPDSPFGYYWTFCTAL